MALLPVLLAALLWAPLADDLEQAQAALQAGRLDEAEKLLRQLLRDPHGTQRLARLTLARLQLDSGRPAPALDTLAPLPLAEDAQASLLTGLIFAALGDEIEFAEGPLEDADYYYGEALAQLELAAALAPADDTKAAVEAAYLALYIFNDWARAESLADQALAGAPGDGEALLARGCARVRGYAEMQQHMTPTLVQSNWDAAVADLLAASEALGSERSEPWWQLIWMYEQGDRPADAVAAALAHHDASGRQDPSTLLRLALTFAREGRLEASLTALQALVDRDRDGLLAGLRAADDPTADAVTLSRAAGPLLDRGRRAQARDLLAVLCEADPQDADLFNNYAFLCRETAGRGGDEAALELYERAYQAYERALTIDAGDPRLLNDTALILQYHLHRDLDHARELYERAVALAEAALAGQPDAETTRQLRSARNDARNNLSRLPRSAR